MSNVVHCWKGYREHLEEVHGWGTDAYWDAWIMTWSEDGQQSYDSTCMLLDGHEGEHVFTPDDEIVVRFVAPPTGETMACCDLDDAEAAEVLGL